MRESLIHNHILRLEIILILNESDKLVPGDL